MKPEEDINVEQPEGFVENGNDHCKLKDPLYDLEESSRHWKKVFNELLQEITFSQNQADPVHAYLFKECRNGMR